MPRLYQRAHSAFLWCQYNHRGTTYRESTRETDPAKAKAYLKHRLQELGADALGLLQFHGPANEKVLVSELLDALAADFRLRGIRSIKQSQSHIERAKRAFGAYRAVEISPALVDRWYESQKRVPGCPRIATLNRTVSMLSQSLKLAHRHGSLSQPPILRHLSELANARRGFFEADQFERVCANLPDHLQDFARFAYISGWRKGEIASLTWADVDLAGKVIRLRPEHSKNAQGRVLALEGELWELIERAKKARQVSWFLFHRRGKRIGDFRKAWEHACSRAGVPSALFHDIRRTAARNLVRAGVPERIVMACTGHKTRSVLDRYNIVSETDLRDAQKKLQAFTSSR